MGLYYLLLIFFYFSIWLSRAVRRCFEITQRWENISIRMVRECMFALNAARYVYVFGIHDNVYVRQRSLLFNQWLWIIYVNVVWHCIFECGSTKRQSQSTSFSFIQTALCSTVGDRTAPFYLQKKKTNGHSAWICFSPTVILQIFGALKFR